MSLCEDELIEEPDEPFEMEPKRTLKEVLKDYEARAKRENLLLISSNQEFAYKKDLKIDQLPVVDARISPTNDKGDVWTVAKQAILDEKRARTRLNSENREIVAPLSEEQIQANKEWLEKVRIDAPTIKRSPKECIDCGSVKMVGETPDTLSLRCEPCYRTLLMNTKRPPNTCGGCPGLIEAQQHEECRCWQCSTPLKKLVSQERYNELIEEELGFPLPKKECSCRFLGEQRYTTGYSNVSVRCEDCIYRGKLRLSPKSLKELVVDPGHNVPNKEGVLKLVPGLQCVCVSCVDRREVTPSLGYCPTCVKLDLWRSKQHIREARVTFNATTSFNPSKEQRRMDREAEDFIKTHFTETFIHHSNTRVQMDEKIVSEQLVEEAKFTFNTRWGQDYWLGADYVLVQVVPEAIKEEEYDGLSVFERGLKYAAPFEKKQMLAKEKWIKDNPEICLAATTFDSKPSNPKALYPWELPSED